MKFHDRLTISEISGSGEADVIFILLKKGRGEGTIDAKTYAVREGDMVIVHPCLKFRLSSSTDNPLNGICLSFHIPSMNSWKLWEPNFSPVIPLRNHFLVMEDFFETIVREFESPSLGSQDMIEIFLQAITIKLMRIIESMKTPENSSITQKVKEYIEMHFDLDLSLTDLAELVHVNHYYLIHTFKQDMGLTPIQYLIHCRIEEAKRLLKGTDMSIHDISVRVGYPNPNYFNQMFKKVVGITPGNFRKS